MSYLKDVIPTGEHVLHYWLIPCFNNVYWNTLNRKKICTISNNEHSLRCLYCVQVTMNILYVVYIVYTTVNNSFTQCIVAFHASWFLPFILCFPGFFKSGFGLPCFLSFRFCFPLVFFFLVFFHSNCVCFPVLRFPLLTIQIVLVWFTPFRWCFPGFYHVCCVFWFVLHSDWVSLILSIQNVFPRFSSFRLCFPGFKQFRLFSYYYPFRFYFLIFST